VLLVEDHETPAIRGAALVRTGTAFDPPGQEGLADLTAYLLRASGTRQRSAEQVENELDRLGATVDVSMGETMASVFFFSLKANLAPSLTLFRDLLTTPAFRSDRVAFAKSLSFNLIARRNDDPQQVMRREFLALLRGKSTLARRPEYASIGAIERRDVEAFYRRYFSAANIMLVFSGDFDSAALKGALETLFGGWKSEPQPVPEFPKPPAEGPGGAFLATKPDARQAHIAFGRPGLTYRDKDAAALEIALDIVAGGPESRLSRRRTPGGNPAEDLRADAVPGLPFAAPAVFTGTAPAGDGGDAVAAIVDELQKLRSAEPAEDELRAARETAWERTCAGLDNRWKAAFAAATAEYYGYPADWAQQYVKALEQVTRADVLRVARERLDPAAFTLMGASSAPALVDPRTTTAAARVDLTIPNRPAAPATLSTGSAEEAKKLLARAQQAAGGADRLAAVKDSTIRTVHALVTGGKDEELEQWIAPSILREDGTAPVGRLIRFTDGAGGWVSNGYNSAALNGPIRKQVEGDLLRHMISLLLSDRSPARKLGMVDEQTIEVVLGESSVRVVFDQATGLPSEADYEVATERQPILMQEIYSDYRDVNGIQLPFQVVTIQNGVKYADGQVIEIKLNQGLKPEVLQKRP
jgi:zinc protease